MTFYSDPDGYKIIRTCGANFCELNFLCCDNSSILKAFLLLLPRKNVVAKKKEKIRGQAGEYIAQYFSLPQLCLLRKQELLGPYGSRRATAYSI